MESQIVDEYLVEDKFKGLCWRTKEGELIPIRDMRDSHLRNAALFLMGMGYTRCAASDVARVAWLMVLRKEWERRMIGREVVGPPVKTTFTKTKCLSE